MFLQRLNIGAAAWAEVALYLAPSAALAALIYALSRRYPIFLLLQLAGTICHELAHFVVGLLTFAQPASFSIIPRKSGRTWQLGEVKLANLRWYNAAPTALAPFLIILLPIGVALWRTGPGWRFIPLDAALAFALAPQFLACWPSMQDWKLALRSWPYAALLVVLWWFLRKP